MGYPKPHRLHDKWCSLNQKMPGRSARTVEVERSAAHNLWDNNRHPATLSREENQKHTSDLRAYCVPRRGPRTTTTTAAAATAATTTPLAPPDDSVVISLPTAEDTQLEVIYRLQQDKYAKAPPAMSVAIDFGIGLFNHCRPSTKKRKDARAGHQLEKEEREASANVQQARQNFRQLFPAGQAEYKFPAVDPNGTVEIHPQYHSISARSFFYLDWELLSGNTNLVNPCPICKDNVLRRGRKNKRLFPLWHAHNYSTYYCMNLVSSVAIWVKVHRCC